ncbi:MAG TPA: group 1 truncated hemoglobin [Acidiferrobacteraceae bacterium]|nr:group 1 truncated hemoglobin [Acidiferrobacteraceae bacterium]
MSDTSHSAAPSTTVRPCWRRLVATALLLSATAWVPASAHSPSLYEALGAKPGIHAMVRTFIHNVARDNRINGYFAHTDLKHLRAMLTLQFCQLSGGPCSYGGPDMRSTHAQLGVTGAAFNALVEDLQAAMGQHHVPLSAQNHLLALLAPMKSDIVTK